jgi:hypothetical protein
MLAERQVVVPLWWLNLRFKKKIWVVIGNDDFNKIKGSLINNAECEFSSKLEVVCFEL